MKLRLKKRCPRCGTKVEYEMVHCPECKLNFQKFEQATNKVAKQKIRQGESSNVLMRTGRPADVKLWKLLLMAIFLGFMGGHHYYVGRYKMGIFYTIFFVVGVLNAALENILKNAPSTFAYELFSLLVLVWGAVGIMWIIDVAKICLNKFKIPVSRLE